MQLPWIQLQSQTWPLQESTRPIHVPLSTITSNCPSPRLGICPHRSKKERRCRIERQGLGELAVLFRRRTTSFPTSSSVLCVRILLSSPHPHPLASVVARHGVDGLRWCIWSGESSSFFHFAFVVVVVGPLGLSRAPIRFQPEFNFDCQTPPPQPQPPRKTPPFDCISFVCLDLAGARKRTKERRISQY